MITVTISKEQSGRVHSFEMTGHAEFAEHGKDLVCAGASAIIFGSINAIHALTGFTPEIIQHADGGYLKVNFQKAKENDSECQLIIQAMIVSLQTIELDYGEHIQINFQ